MFKNNQLFVRLTQWENLLSGRRARRSHSIREMSQPLIDGIERLLQRGAAAGAFMMRADRLQLYIGIVALSAYHINNRHTLWAVFGRVVADPDCIAARREHALEMIMRHVGARSGGLWISACFPIMPRRDGGAENGKSRRANGRTRA